MSSTSRSSIPLDSAVIREAAQWLVRLHSGQAGPEDYAACERWRQSCSDHEAAWRKAERLSKEFGAIPPTVGVTVLTRQTQANRRAALKTLMLVGATMSMGLLGYRYAPWSDWAADYRSATGENRDIMLADGSQIMLNTSTAMDVRFSRSLRLVQLRRGEIYVQTAPDVGELARPFIVKTPQGRLRALGTRFAVQRLEENAAATCLSVFEHRVEITPLASGGPQIIEAGQRVCFTDRSISLLRPEPLPAASAPADGPAWAKGVLYADKTRLDTFLAELARYRPGIVRCDPRVAGLHLSGVFQLADTDNILHILGKTLPVSVLRHTKYWITVGPRRG